MSDIAEQLDGPPVYDLFSGADPVRSWTSNLEPTLQRINARFVRFLRAALLQHLRRGVTVTPTGIHLVEHRELMEKLEIPTHLTLFTMQPLRGTVVLMVDAPLVVSLVESRFGGNGRFPINTANRDFTAFELKSMRRVVDTTLEQYVAAWEAVGRVEIGQLRQETNPNFASFAPADELILTSTYDVEIDQGKGKIAIFIPYASIEPLEDQLTAGLVTDAAENDAQWVEMLRQGVEQAPITLNVELGTIDISFGDLVGLRPGNVFEMDRPGSLVVESNGVPLFRGAWGRHGRKIGVLVEERLSPPTQEPPRPARRAVAREDG